MTPLVIVGVYLVLCIPFAVFCGRCLAFGQQDEASHGR